MPSANARDRDPLWTVPRAAALVVVLLAAGSFAFYTHTTSTAPTYGPVQDRAYVLSAADDVYDGVEAGPQRTGLPVPVARTVADMRSNYANEGSRLHVFVHGANIMVTFPKEAAVCVWVPVIVDGPKEPSIVSC
jgi:hypothetical protein